MELSQLLITVASSIIFGYVLCLLRNKTAKPQNLPKQAPLSSFGLPAETTTYSEKKLMEVESLAIIEKLSEAITSALNIDNLAYEIVNAATKILNLEICALLLLDEETETLNIAASTGIKEELASSTRVPLGEEISGVVAKVNQITILTDLENKAPLYNLKYETYYKNSLASIPLCVKYKVIGVLNISNRKNGKPFSNVDIDIAKIIALEASVALQNLRLLKQQQKTYLDTIIALASAVDARDPYTYMHSRNVTRYSVRIAQELKLASRLIENIRQAGLLHDIGKIGIRDAILSKPGKLTDEEYAVMKTHPLKGEEIIKSLPFLEDISKIIKHHHERYDTKGYPDGIGSEAIELGARIMAVADAFDAMTTDRPYRKALSLDIARAELIKNKGTQFDPAIADCFLKILEKEPQILSNS